MSFKGISEPLLRALREVGLEKPTPIQEKAIPPILSGKNVLIVAPTGYGKTEAAVIPILEAYLRLREKPDGIAILYITPLRALNRDILRRLRVLCTRVGLEVDVRHGDTDARVRRRQSLKPPKMLITTPETLQAILPGRRMRRHFESLRWVVVDEVHELLESKRGIQLTVALERLKALRRSRLQIIGISATVADPETAARFIGGPDPVEPVVLEESREVRVVVDNPKALDEDFKMSSSLALPADAVARMRVIGELAGKTSVLVFTNTREHSEVLASRLRALTPELNIDVHHGSLSREVRREAEERIREGVSNALICTSSMELGVDIGILDTVVQYMSPRQVVRLVHRIGRSGHGLDRVSRGLILTASPEDSMEAAVIARRMLLHLLEKPRIYESALDVLAHQIAGLVLDFREIGMREAYEIVKRAYPYRRLGWEDFVKTVELMVELRTVNLVRDRLRATWRTHRYYYENLSTIPDVKHYRVKNVLDGRVVGILDQEFVGERGEPGLVFIMKGQTWRILSVDHENLVVNVEPSTEVIGAVPSWEGELIPVSMEVAEEVYRVLAEIAGELKRNGDPLKPLAAYNLTEEARSRILEYVKEQLDRGFPVPSPDRILVEAFRDVVVLHTPFGDLVNRTLALALTALLSNRLGYAVGFQTDQYRICLIGVSGLTPEDVARELRSLKAEELPLLLESTLPETGLFAWRLWHVAVRFGIVARGANYSVSRVRALVETYRDTPVFEEALREVLTDKLDLEGASKVLDGISRGGIRVETVPRGLAPSPMAIPILEKAIPQDVLRPAYPGAETLRILKQRLMNTRVKLICVYNNDWETVLRVSNIPERVRCPRCGSTLIAVVSPWDRDSRKVVAKWLRRARMSREERNLWLSLWRSASLVQSLGRLAVMVMAGRGVGPMTASRILGKPYRTEEDLLTEILKAEIEYIRTRPFWD